MWELRWAVVVWLAVGAAVALAATPPRDQRPRTIRGFKNVALSTARGFGKRSSLEPNNQDTLPADWFAEEMSGNPELARLVVRKFLDSDGDGLLSSSELLRPLGFQGDGYD